MEYSIMTRQHHVQAPPLILPAVESGEGGGWDVHAVEADEGEEIVAEFLNFFGVELLAVGG